jgi:hypothetical protein
LDEFDGLCLSSDYRLLEGVEGPVFAMVERGDCRAFKWKKMNRLVG